MRFIDDQKVLKALEYDRIADILQKEAVTAVGKEICRQIKPMTDYKDIKKAQLETENAISLILKTSSPPVFSSKDMRNVLQRVKLGGILSCEELADIAFFLCTSEKVKAYGQDNDGILSDLFSKISLADGLKDEIKSKIDNNEVADNASSELSSIRKKIKQTNLQVKKILNDMIKSSKEKLQDGIIYNKNNRYCLAVRCEFKNSFGGIVHDQSLTGATVFLEPNAVVNANNQIRELQLLEQKEIQKILSDLSGQVMDNYQVLSQNVYAISVLDSIFARAKLAISMNASMPKLNQDNLIELKNARHPLIDRDKVVPLNISLGKDFKTLVVTGPNTGGKTVTLKTVGLFVLMAQSGLFIPADEGSQICVFKNIFVDIGDEQSIEQNLSTFSAHMKNINQIIKCVDSNSLVLLDELGAGTDPVEGAALAIAILEHLFSLGAKMIITSHYSELKLYALSTEGVENASCEFDVQTLLPTYKLLIGIPGKSNAFEISKKIGISEQIIDCAKKHLQSRDVRFEDIMREMTIRSAEVEQKNKQAEELFFSAQKLKAEMEAEIKKIRASSQKQIEKAKKKALEIINSAMDKSDLLLKNYRQNNFKKAEEIRAQIKSERENLLVDKSDYRKEDLSADVGVRSVKVGDKLFSTVMNKVCVVKSLPDSQGNVNVSVGSFVTSLPLDSFRICKTDDKNSSPKHYSHGSNFSSNKSFSISSRIDVRGCTADDALNLIDKYIDDAVVAKLDTVTIVHGKGSWVLKKAVSDYLKQNASVKSFRAGNYGEGDLGVTIVELK